MSIADGQNLCLFKQKAKYHALFRICTYIFSKSNKIDAVVTQQNDIYESSNESYITHKKKEKCAAIRQISIQDEILQFTYYSISEAKKL